MSRLERVVAVMIAVCVLSVMLAQMYRHGEHVGYANGWSDANCGVGKSCEGGEE